MEFKVCTKCNIKKDISEFRKSGKYYKSWCKVCERENLKVYYKNNMDEITNILEIDTRLEEMVKTASYNSKMNKDTIKRLEEEKLNDKTS